MKEQPVNYLKVLREGRVTPFAIDKRTRASYILPEGKWLPKRKPIICQSGYHFIRNIWELPDWISNGTELWIVHVRGARVDSDPRKGCAESMKLVKNLKITHEERGLIYHDGYKFDRIACNHARSLANARGLSFNWNDRAMRYKRPQQTKYLRTLNKIMKRNGIEKWGDPV